MITHKHGRSKRAAASEHRTRNFVIAIAYWFTNFAYNFDYFYFGKTRPLKQKC